MNKDLIFKVKQMVEGDALSPLLEEIKNDIALSIVQTPFNAKDEREELYMLTRAIDRFKCKLQEYVNEYGKIQENE